MGLNYNSAVDQDLMPNQASPGADYSVAVPAGAPATTVMKRQGVITRVNLSGRAAQTTNQVMQFDPAGKWLPGDTVFVHGDIVTGGAGTIAIENKAGAVLTTWPPNVGNGGIFVVVGSGDLVPVVPGVSSSSPLPATGPVQFVATNASSQSIANTTVTPVTGWTVEGTALGGGFVAATGIFTAPVAGRYLVSLQLGYNPTQVGAGSGFDAQIFKNGALLFGNNVVSNSAVFEPAFPQATTCVELAVGDTLNPEAFQSSGAACTVGTAASANRFAVTLLNVG